VLGDLAFATLVVIMSNFTPVASLVGGALIGASASLLLTLNGRIAGISGIVAGSFRSFAKDSAWRVAFVAGLVLGGAAMMVAAPSTMPVPAGTTVIASVVAGLLVGVGTQVGGGCTSGHGVCGVSRISPRSIVATVTFMATGAATVFATHHLLGHAS
jgi:uncharacterized membrane protein YedE/YeeE